MKLSLNQESADVLRSLSTELVSVEDNLNEATSRIQNVVSSLQDSLGIHKEDFLRVFQEVSSIGKKMNEALPLASRMNETADRIETYLYAGFKDNFSLGNISQANHLYTTYQSISGKISKSMGVEVSTDMNPIIDRMTSLPQTKEEVFESYCDGLYESAGESLRGTFESAFEEEYRGKNNRSAKDFFNACLTAGLKGDADTLASFEKHMPQTFQAFVDMISPTTCVNGLEYSVQKDISKLQKKNQNLEYIYSGQPRTLSATEQEWHYDSMTGGEVFNAPLITGLSLDCEQGKAWVPSKKNYYRGTCGLVSCMNVLRLSGVKINEQAIVDYAVSKNLCSSFGNSSAELGGTNCYQRKNLLSKMGLNSDLKKIDKKEDFSSKLGAWVSEGRGVILSVNAYQLWGMQEEDIGWHAITVTSAVKQGDKYVGFYVCDSGSGCKDFARYYTTDELQKAFFIDSLDGDYYSKPLNVTDIIR